MQRGPGYVASPAPAGAENGPSLLQENAPPLGGIGGAQLHSAHRGKGPELVTKFAGEEASGSLGAGSFGAGTPANREFGLKADVRPGTGLAPAPPGALWGARSPQRQRAFGFQAGGLAPGLGFDHHRRKRPVDPTVYVDDEFRDEALERPALRSRTPTSACPGLESTPAASSSAIVGADTAMAWSAPAPTEAATVGLFHRDATPAMSTGAEADDGGAEDVDMEDKENEPRASAVGVAIAAEPSRALREMLLEVPPECKEHPYSDIESSEDGDFRSENLAEQLAERVQQNEGDRYHFDVYIDPE